MFYGIVVWELLVMKRYGKNYFIFIFNFITVAF